MAKFNIKDQLAGVAALIAAIVAIGGGFVKYGEITTKLNALTEQTGPDLTPLAQPSAQVETAGGREHDIENDQIELVGRCPKFCSRRVPANGKPALSEIAGQQSTQSAVIFD